MSVDIEGIDVIRAKLSDEGFKGFLQGSIIQNGFNRDTEKITTYARLLTEVTE